MTAVVDAGLSDPLELADRYARAADRMGLSPESVRSYVRGVRDFCTWLAEQDKFNPAEVFDDPVLAKQVTRAFVRHLVVDQKKATKTADARLTAVSSLYQWLGRARPDVRMQTGKNDADPRGLSDEQTVELLRAAERRGIRDHALVVFMLSTGVRVQEASALDVDDVMVSERVGEAIIRWGKGGKTRKVPVNGPAAKLTRAWLAERRTTYGMPDHEGPLWVTSGGRRLAVRSIRHVIYQTTYAAELEDVSPHVLRHTFGQKAKRSGVDDFTLADLMGHEDVNTTRQYARSSRMERADAAERITWDY